VKAKAKANANANETANAEAKAKPKQKIWLRRANNRSSACGRHKALAKRPEWPLRFRNWQLSRPLLIGPRGISP